MKRSSDFSFTKEEEQKKLEQLKNELHALRGDPMELENTNLTPMTPGTPSVFDTQPFISPAVDMTPTASAKRRREQQLSDLKKLRSEALQLSSSKGSVTPSTPSTPSMFNMPAKKHESPPPARKLDFGGDQISTPETKPPSQTNLFGNNFNVGTPVAKPTPATLPTPSRIQFITSPTVPVVNTPPTKPSVPTAVIKTDIPIPSPPKESYKDKDEDSNDESKPQKKKRQLSDTDLDPQKKASLISATTNFPPIPTKIVSPNIVQPKTSPAKPSRAEVLRNAQTFDFGAPSVAVTPTPAPSGGASPFTFGAPSTDNKTGGSTAAPFGFGTPSTDNKTPGTTASPFGFGAPSTDKTPAFGFGTPSTSASPFSFGPAPTSSGTDKPKDQAESKPSAGNFSFDFNSTASKTSANKPEDKKTESNGAATSTPFFGFDNKPADKSTQSPFAFAPTKPAEETKSSTVTTLVDNSSPFNFNANKPSNAPQSFDFGSAKPANQSPTQSTLGSSVKSEMSASELMKSDRSVESAGWREERGSHFGSERNELFKDTMSPSSSQRSDQDPSEEKSSEETDSEHEEEDEEREESEESDHSDDSDGWFTGPTPKAKPRDSDDVPLTSTPTKPDNKPKVQPTSAAPKYPIVPQFSFGTGTPSFGVQDKPTEEKKAEVPSISFGSPTNKTKEEKRPESPAPVFSFSPRQLDKTEEKKPEVGFGFGSFSFTGEPKDKTPELPAASPKLSFESFTPKLEPEQPDEEGQGPFNGVPAFSLGGKSTETKPAETKPEEKKSEEKPSIGFNFGVPASEKPKAEENKSETGFGFGAPSFSFGQTLKSDNTDSKKDEATPVFGGFGIVTSDKPKEEKPEEKKGDNTTGFGFGFGTTTPSFSFGQPAKTEQETKPDANAEDKTATPSFGFNIGATSSDKPKEEKTEVSKPETPSTGFGFGSAPSFGATAPSFSFGQSATSGPTETKTEEPKEFVTSETPAEKDKPEDRNTNEAVQEDKADSEGDSEEVDSSHEAEDKEPSDEQKDEDKETKTEEKPKDETKPVEEKKNEVPSTGFGFGFGGTPSFGTTNTPSFSFGRPAENKSEEKKPESGSSTGFGFGFGGTPSFGTTTPSFSFGQTTETKPETKAEETKVEAKPDEEKKPEENKPEEKKPETGSSTGFGFGFGTTSFGTGSTPSFSFGQSAAETKSDEKKPEEPKVSEKPQESTEAPKFDLSAMGAATFKFGQTEEKKQDEAPQPSFGFSFGGGLLEKDKAAQDKPSKHLKDPMKPIPDESDDEDSDSDDDKPVKPKNTSTSNTSSSTTSYSFAPSSFSFTPSSLNVPASTDASKSTETEQPKFEFQGIQFGEASMTKRLGSDFGLTDNKMSAANTDNLNGSGTGFGSFNFGSSDKIFGQVSAAPLTTFSSLSKSDDKKEEKKDDNKDKIDETKHEEKAEKPEEPETKDDKHETDEPKHDDKEEKSEQPEAKDDKEKVDEPSVNDSTISESEESQSVSQSVNESVSESVNTTVEASHDDGSDSDPASASDDDLHEGEHNVTDAIDEKHATTLSHVRDTFIDTLNTTNNSTFSSNVLLALKIVVSLAILLLSRRKKTPSMNMKTNQLKVKVLLKKKSLKTSPKVR